MQKKQVLLDPGYVEDVKDACSLQNNVEDVEDIKTSHNRFH